MNAMDSLVVLASHTIQVNIDIDGKKGEEMEIAYDIRMRHVCLGDRIV